MNDERILICYRVADEPIPSALSTIKQCSDCGARIWVAHTSPKARAVCMPCVRVRIADDPDPQFESPTPTQLADIARWLRGKMSLNRANRRRDHRSRR